MSTYALRKRLVAIERQDVGKTEVSRNQAPFIKRLWPATTFPEGHALRQPYCAAGQCWGVREWLKDPEVLFALGMTAQRAESWRCKSASAYKASDSWMNWAKLNGLWLPANSILKTGDLVVYRRSHIELVTDDDGTPSGRFIALGYNTNSAGSRDGEGVWEKESTRSDVYGFIRLMQP